MVDDGPWEHQLAGGPGLRLLMIPIDVMHRLARGEPVQPLDGHRLTEYVRGTECRALWKMRSAQILGTPSDAPWITRLVVSDQHDVVGLAGFHGAPSKNGTVEVGYRIDPQHRRNGYARASLETLLSVAETQPDVRTVRATISPKNAASRSLVADYGFSVVEEQWDDQDGLEIVFEVSIDRSDRPLDSTHGTA